MPAVAASINQDGLLDVTMTEFDPSQFSHNYRRSISNPIPVAFSDQEFLDQVAETTKIFDVKKRLLPGPVRNTEEDGNWKQRRNINVMNNMIEGKQVMKDREEKSVLLRGGERRLWESSDWREKNKDLNQSFTKLSPIITGRKSVQGGMSYVFN